LEDEFEIKIKISFASKHMAKLKKFFLKVQYNFDKSFMMNDNLMNKLAADCTTLRVFFPNLLFNEFISWRK
jgi:hypothetical protein